MAKRSDDEPADTGRDGRPRIEFVLDQEHPGGVMLLMDSVRQSYVDLTDPSYLEFEYIQFFASVLGTIDAGPLATTHIGGGGLTMARYLTVERPDSPQIVLEPDVELTRLVRERLPLPRRHRIRIRPLDGATGVAQLADASADLVILDAFADGRVPPELVALDFLTDVSRVLKSTGLFLVNVVDEPGLRYIGRVVAGLRERFDDVILVASSDVLKGRRFGNVVLAASGRELDLGRLEREIRRQPFPAGLLDATELGHRFAGAKPFTGDDAQSSPEPIRGGWRIR
jgi:spermidine synthase